MRTFHDIHIQVDSIFISIVITLPNNSMCLGSNDTAMKLLRLLECSKIDLTNFIAFLVPQRLHHF